MLPGACAAWGYRRHTSSYGNRLRDWLLRLGGLSAAMWCVGGWPAYWVYANYREPFAAGETDQLDLYISRALHLDQQTGAFTYRSPNTLDGPAHGHSAMLDFTGGGLLMKWSEVEHLEFTSSDASLEQDPLGDEETHDAP